MLRNVGVIAIIVSIVLVPALALDFYGTGGHGGTLAPPQTDNIVNGLITVDAGEYEYYQFTVPPGATDVQVQGSFTGSGGSGNDVEVLIMNSMNFMNWENGRQTSTYYDSGQVTASTFDVHLPSSSGSYCLIYSNTFSIMNGIDVNTQANLSYVS